MVLPFSGGIYLHRPTSMIDATKIRRKIPLVNPYLWGFFTHSYPHKWGYGDVFFTKIHKKAIKTEETHYRKTRLTAITTIPTISP